MVHLCCAAMLLLAAALPLNGVAQVNDSLPDLPELHLSAEYDSLVKANNTKADTTQVKVAVQTEKTAAKKNLRFVPDPQRALWLGLIFPGGGQIYNRKYWKLPIVYGGFFGCAYAYKWNNQMYKDYSQAYLDIMDDNPNTKSYEKMLPLNYDITGKEERFKTIFRKKKDYYRRYRDMSMFCMVGVYLLAVVDAYVDAELSQFDISKDLSLKVEPAIIRPSQHSPMRSEAYGLQCSLSF